MESEIMQIGHLTCDCVNAGSRHTCYLLVPMAMDEDEISALAEKYGYNIVSIHGIDWDNELTPWTAPGVYRGEPDFRGEAGEFLGQLRERVIPKAESFVDASAGRTLIGVSLSGLFALWAWMQGEDFDNILSISGSFWYGRLVEWLQGQDIPSKPGFAYFSLGNKEGNSSDYPRYRTVQQNTVRVVETLRQNGIRAMFEQTTGTHYAPFIPRLEKALKALAGSDAEI